LTVDPPALTDAQISESVTQWQENTAVQEFIKASLVNAMPGVLAEYVVMNFTAQMVQQPKTRRLQETVNPQSGQGTVFVTLITFNADYTIDMPKDVYEALPAETTTKLVSAAPDDLATLQAVVVAAVANSAGVPISSLSANFTVNQIVVQVTEASGAVVTTTTKPARFNEDIVEESAASGGVVVLAILITLGVMLCFTGVVYWRTKMMAERSEDGKKPVEEKV